MGLLVSRLKGGGVFDVSDIVNVYHQDVLVTLAIYGDDTTIVGKASEWNEGVTVVKREMGR